MKKVLSIIAALVVVAGILAACSKGEAPIVTSYYSPGDYFTSNVKNSKKMFRVTIVLVAESTDEAVSTEFLTKENAVIRDTIYTILRDLEEVDIATLEGSDALRERITTAVNTRLETELITGVLFNDYIMQ